MAATLTRGFHSHEGRIVRSKHRYIVGCLAVLGVSLLAAPPADAANPTNTAPTSAAVISQLVGKPIRVAYSRSDEHAWENYGQAYTITITGAVDSSGPKAKLSAWKREAWTSSRGGRPGPPGNMASGILMGFPETPFAASVPSRSAGRKSRRSVAIDSSIQPYSAALYFQKC